MSRHYRQGECFQIVARDNDALALLDWKFGDDHETSTDDDREGSILSFSLSSPWQKITQFRRSPFFPESLPVVFQKEV